MSGQGKFWLFTLCPKIWKIIFKLPIPTKIQFLLYIGGWPHGVVVKYSLKSSSLLQTLEDNQGKVVKATSEVEEKDGKLWMGSVDAFHCSLQLDLKPKKKKKKTCNPDKGLSLLMLEVAPMAHSPH